MSGFSINANGQRAMAGMAKSLGVQKMGASLIEKTLEKSQEMQTMMKPNNKSFSGFTGKGQNIDVKV